MKYELNTEMLNHLGPIARRKNMSIAALITITLKNLD